MARAPSTQSRPRSTASRQSRELASWVVRKRLARGVSCGECNPRSQDLPAHHAASGSRNWLGAVGSNHDQSDTSTRPMHHCRTPENSLIEGLLGRLLPRLERLRHCRALSCGALRVGVCPISGKPHHPLAPQDRRANPHAQTIPARLRRAAPVPVAAEGRGRQQCPPDHAADSPRVVPGRSRFRWIPIVVLLRHRCRQHRSPQQMIHGCSAPYFFGLLG